MINPIRVNTFFGNVSVKGGDMSLDRGKVLDLAAGDQKYGFDVVGDLLRIADYNEGIALGSWDVNRSVYTEAIRIFNGYMMERGINWTIRTSAADNNWYSVTYGNGLFVAVAATGTGNRVMTSGKQEINIVS